MYIILVHVTGIALLEILFYFYYIGPIESELLKNSMKHITIKQIDEYNMHYNITEVNKTEFVKKLKIDNDKAKKKRENDNYELYLKALEYWFILVSFTIFVTIVEFYVRYLNNKNKKVIKVDSSQGLELMPIRARLNSVESDDITVLDNEEINIIHTNIDVEQQLSDSIEPTFDINNNDYIILKKKLTCKRVIKKIIYYILFIGLLLAFEYSFFQYIVLKYDPLSDNEIQYIIFEEIVNDISK